MRKCKSIDYTQERKLVAKLYYAVLTERLSVRDALTKFPQDCEDKTVTTAWYALCHLESDEELRIKDAMYREEQDGYLEFIAQTLEKGEQLPNNIINAYTPYHTEALNANSKTLKGFIQKMKKFLCC